MLLDSAPDEWQSYYIYNHPIRATNSHDFIQTVVKEFLSSSAKDVASPTSEEWMSLEAWNVDTRWLLSSSGWWHYYSFHFAARERGGIFKNASHHSTKQSFIKTSTWLISTSAQECDRRTKSTKNDIAFQCGVQILSASIAAVLVHTTA